VHDLTAAIFSRKSLLAAIDPALGKYLTVSVAYRGKLSMRDSEWPMGLQIADPFQSKMRFGTSMTR
jgi:hypothetical protein